MLWSSQMNHPGYLHLTLYMQTVCCNVSTYQLHLKSTSLAVKFRGVEVIKGNALGSFRNLERGLCVPSIKYKCWIRRHHYVVNSKPKYYPD